MTIEEDVATSYQPVKMLIVRADGLNNPSSYALRGPRHVLATNFNKPVSLFEKFPRKDTFISPNQ